MAITNPAYKSHTLPNDDTIELTQLEGNQIELKITHGAAVITVAVPVADFNTLLRKSQAILQMVMAG